MKIFAVIVLLACVALGANAQCFPGETPDVCKYGTNLLVPRPGTSLFEQCADINQNPFSVAPVFGDVDLSASQCATAAREDGKDCIRFYAEAQCAGACKKCATIVCPKFCNNRQSVCPTANALGCFDFVTCAEAGTPCTDWEVANDLPDPIRTTTVSTTRTTRTTTASTSNSGGTTTTDDDSSDASTVTVGFAMLIFAFFFFFT